MANIGLIGIGLMGHGIGGNLLNRGHSLTILGHRNRTPVDDLLAKGATEAATAQALADTVDTIIVCVTGSPEFCAVADGYEGFLAGLGPGKIVIDCTTGEPAVVLDYAARIQGLGSAYSDCPLARTPTEAEAGMLNVMVGADSDTFERIRPILDCFCENIFHIGPVGAGARIKLINNLITMGQAALIAEAVAALKATGVDLNIFYEMISKGGGNSGIFQMIMPAFLEQNSFDGMGFSLANAAKDLRYYNRMVGDERLAAPMGAAVYDRLITAQKLGFDDGLVGHLVAASLKLNGLAPDASRKPHDVLMEVHEGRMVRQTGGNNAKTA